MLDFANANEVKELGVVCVYVCAVGLLLMNFRNSFYVNRAARRRNYVAKKKKTLTTDRHPFPGVSSTFNPSRRAAAHPRLRHLNHLDGRTTLILSIIYFSKISPHIIFMFMP